MFCFDYHSHWPTNYIQLTRELFPTYMVHLQAINPANVCFYHWKKFNLLCIINDGWCWVQWYSFTKSTNTARPILHYFLVYKTLQAAHFQLLLYMFVDMSGMEAIITFQQLCNKQKYPSQEEKPSKQRNIVHTIEQWQWHPWNFM